MGPCIVEFYSSRSHFLKVTCDHTKHHRGSFAGMGLGVSGLGCPFCPTVSKTCAPIIPHCALVFKQTQNPSLPKKAWRT